MATASPTPTIDDLREIADFIRQRSLDEAGAAGVMDFYRTNGVTIQGEFPKRIAGREPEEADRVKVAGWIDSHTPDRFVSMVYELAGLADGLADTLPADGLSEVVNAYWARARWRRLTQAARLWQDHPDFQPRWGKDKDASDD